MRHINGGYTTWFNKRHNRYGHLFQGRYKAILVDADPYAGELSRYIHLNPLRAGMVSQPNDYPWSSYAAYSGNAKPSHWLTTDWLLHYFGKKTSDAKKAYVIFVKAAMGNDEEDPLKEATSTLILGDTDFIDDIREKYLNGKKGEKDIPALRAVRKASLEAIIEAVGREFKEQAEVARKAAIHLSHRYSCRSLREIGSMFGIGESAVSQASGRFNEELQGSRTLKRRVERLRKTLELCRVKEWRVALGITLAVSAVSGFVPV